jgi:transposase
VSMEEKRTKRVRRKFTAEFKARAVRLVLREGSSVAQVSRDLDPTEPSLRNWGGKQKVDRGMGPPGVLTTEEREELSRLRKENRISRKNGRSKRETTFFAKDGR